MSGPLRGPRRECAAHVADAIAMIERVIVSPRLAEDQRIAAIAAAHTNLSRTFLTPGEPLHVKLALSRLLRTLDDAMPRLRDGASSVVDVADALGAAISKARHGVAGQHA